MRNVSVLRQSVQPQRTWRQLLDKVGLPAAIVVLVLFFYAQNPKFCSPYSLANIGRQAVTLGLLALGETYVLVGSGVDLSVGGIMNLTSVATALVLLRTGSLPVALLCGLLVGVLMGCLNGFIVSYLNVQAFAVTLGSTSVASGAALLLCGGNSVRNLPGNLSVIANGSLWGIPNQVWILLAVTAALYLLLQHTTFGKSCYAVGGNAKASMLSGIPVKRVRMMTFVISGLCAAVSAIIASSRVGSGNPVIGGDMQLRAIAATVIGGASMRGGMGSVPGTLVGVVFISVLYSGMNFMGITSYVQDVLIGCIIVASAWSDAARRKKNG